jgi:hypothetical protein
VTGTEIDGRSVIVGTSPAGLRALEIRREEGVSGRFTPRLAVNGMRPMSVHRFPRLR